MEGSSRFQATARERGLEVEVRTFQQGTRTAQAAAAAIGCEVGQIVKSLVFVAGGRPVMVLASGADRVDLDALGALAGGQARRADPELVREVTGYAIGGVPPFGHAQELPVYMDDALLAHQVVWAAAGTPRDVFAIDPVRLAELAGAVTCRLRAT